jgi:polyamine oxidase
VELEHPITRRRLAALAGAAAATAAAARVGLPAGAGASGAGVAAASESYDDGSAGIPAASGGDPSRVIVVGAGWAGLTAANALRNAGVDVVVLEARRRLGGRAWTREVGGRPIDLGCSWIHDPIGNPLTRFAGQAGVARRNADIELDLLTIRFYDAVARSELLPTQAVEAFTHAVLFNEQIGDYSERLGPGASVRDAAAAYLADRNLSGAARRRARFAIRLFAEQEENMYWNRISLAYLAAYSSPYDGIGQGDFPRGGYRRLIEAMAAGTEVLLGHRVRRIVRRGPRQGGGVAVEAQRRGDGRRVRLAGSHVLVTVPLGVLKHGAIEFEPGLARGKREAIRRLGYGHFEKVALAFEEPFWQRGGKTHIVRLAEPFGFPLTLDMQRLSGHPTLTALYAGRPAQRLQRASAQRRVELALAAIREALGGASIPAPLDARATAWRRDPFSRGSYSTVIAGRPKTDFDILARPLGPVLFAGEATNGTRNGFSDGAMTSGIREAKRLLQSASVPISAG